ncbi:MAG: acetylornithine transaminase [Chromatiales bacterium]|jgi:acetylornithine aminotransferase
MADPLMATYSRLPVTFARGEGAWLWDAEGTRYLDALSGIAVCGLGHAHPAVAQALCAQARQLVHTSNLYQVAAQQSLGERLAAAAGMDRVFFANSGAEANEAAIKIARLHGHRQGMDVPTIVVAENAFHGRTLATLTATGNRKVQAGFEPLVRGFVRVPYGDLESIRKAADTTQSVVAVMLEPIQGEGGVQVPPPDYLPQVRELCDRQGWLMMLDEVQTGMGRTGRLFAFQHSGITPDVMTLAKGLGNGVPIGACLGRGEAARVLTPGTHGSTFGGNPLACAAAMAVLDVLEREGLAERAQWLGERLMAGLRSELEGAAGVAEIRGMGLMVGIELDRDCSELVRLGLDQGLLVNVTAGRVVRLLPPLVMTEDEIDLLTAGVGALIRAFLAG